MIRVCQVKDLLEESGYLCVFFFGGGGVGEGFKSIFYLYQDLEKAPQIWKSLEFYPDQR